MRFIVEDTHNHIIHARSLRIALSCLAGSLRVSGPRALRAVSETGAVIYSSLYPGEDYILARDGRCVYGSRAVADRVESGR